jgi:hypothetical protein
MGSVARAGVDGCGPEYTVTVASRTATQSASGTLRRSDGGLSAATESARLSYPFQYVPSLTPQVCGAATPPPAAPPAAKNLADRNFRRPKISAERPPVSHPSLAAALPASPLRSSGTPRRARSPTLTRGV